MNHSIRSVLPAVCLFMACALRPVRSDYALRETSTGGYKATAFHKLQLEKIAGLSGLSSYGANAFISVAERGEVLVIFTAESLRENRHQSMIKVRGLPAGLDMEGIAAGGAQEVWVGTESRASHPKYDRVFRLRIKKDTATVVEEIRFPYLDFKKAPRKINRSNRGIEGLCLTPEFLYVATEAPIQLQDGRRLAAMGRYDLKAKTWTPFYVQLQSKKGKLSALSCLVASNSKHSTLLAIERHYEIALVSRIQVSKTLVAETMISSEQLVDLGQLFKTVPNFEGLLATSENQLWVISDNQSHVISGPSILLKLEADQPAIRIDSKTPTTKSPMQKTIK